MKIITKEWKNCYDLLGVIYDLRKETGWKLPVLIDGSSASVQKRDLITVNAGDVQSNFVLVKYTFDFESDYTDDFEPSIKSPQDDFLFQYVNRLRVLPLLPKEVLAKIKDRRLFALGYVGKETDKLLTAFADKLSEEINKKFNEYEEVRNKTFNFTIYSQMDENYFSSVAELLEHSRILKLCFENGDIHIDLDWEKEVILTDAEVIEEECDAVNSTVSFVEIYRNENGFELHLLLKKLDKNFEEKYYYATYSLKDMKFED